MSQKRRQRGGSSPNPRLLDAAQRAILWDRLDNAAHRARIGERHKRIAAEQREQRIQREQDNIREQAKRYGVDYDAFAPVQKPAPWTGTKADWLLGDGDWPGAFVMDPKWPGERLQSSRRNDDYYRRIQRRGKEVELDLTLWYIHRLYGRHNRAQRKRATEVPKK
jgi:hypothetical protein